MRGEKVEIVRLDLKNMAVMGRRELSAKEFMLLNVGVGEDS